MNNNLKEEEERRENLGVCFLKEEVQGKETSELAEGSMTLEICPTSLFFHIIVLLCFFM